MKVQLDFNTKEITLESNVNLKEFFDQVKTLVPNWKEWKLSTNNIFYTTTPYIPWTWVEPFNPHQIICTDKTTITYGTTHIEDNKGVHYLEIN